MQNTPPSDEVLDEIANVVKATMTYPDAVTVFVQTPNGRMGRSVVQPPDAAEDVLEIIRRQLEGEDPRTWVGE
jgi:dihydroorotate dehydrogenase